MLETLMINEGPYKNITANAKKKVLEEHSMKIECLSYQRIINKMNDK